MQPAVPDARIRQLVEGQVDLSGKSDLERARALRSYAHHLVPLAWPGRLLEEHFGVPIQYEPLSVLMPLLAQQTRGFECGGTAYVLARLYRLFGLESYVYNAGLDSTPFTHCVTFVRANEGSTAGLYLQDAHFNAELRLKNEAVPVEVAMDKLASGSHAALSWQSDESSGRPAVVSPGLEAKARELWLENYSAQRIGESGDSILYNLAFTLQRYHLRYEFGKMLLRNVGTDALPAILLMPLGTSGESEVEAVANLARSAHAAATANLLPTQTD